MIGIMLRPLVRGTFRTRNPFVLTLTIAAASGCWLVDAFFAYLTYQALTGVLESASDAYGLLGGVGATALLGFAALKLTRSAFESVAAIVRSSGQRRRS